jgi:hypothetical protein
MFSVSDFYRWTNRCSAFLDVTKLPAPTLIVLRKMLQISAYFLATSPFIAQ